ncbi:MAG TPA: hypothetical protein VEW93_09265 [Acidimicrobiales bacterium]|nr:hypothetical protein [Acidimicrobiales bacterium]
MARAGLVASVVSGAPSTAWALAEGSDPLAAARAAGTLLPGRRHRPGLVAGAVAHGAVSAGWSLALGALARRRPVGPLAGAAAGAAIAALDLGVLGRRWPAVAALPAGPQWADHLCFGAVFGLVLRARSS